MTRRGSAAATREISGERGPRSSSRRFRAASSSSSSRNRRRAPSGSKPRKESRRAANISYSDCSTSSCGPPSRKVMALATRGSLSSSSSKERLACNAPSRSSAVRVRIMVLLSSLSAISRDRVASLSSPASGRKWLMFVVISKWATTKDAVTASTARQAKGRTKFAGFIARLFRTSARVLRE